jgi:hypothetical protein
MAIASDTLDAAALFTRRRRAARRPPRARIALLRCATSCGPLCPAARARALGGRR